MTPQEFKKARKSMGLTQDQLAEILNMAGKKAISRYETAVVAIPGPVIFAMTALLNGYRPPG